MGERDDYLKLLHGEITSEEYVRRLNERVNARRAGYRYFEVDRTPRPWRGLSPNTATRAGFWAGVRSIFRWGR